MACIDEELVLRFLGGELSIERLSEVEQHLDACKTCFDLVVAATPSRGSAPTAGTAPPPASASALPGQVIAGRYEVRSLLGVGASGQVFAAFDRLAQAEVALKLLRSDLAADPRWIGRLTRELQIARRLSHPHVCRVLDLEEAGGHRFLTMELAAGSLREELRADRARAGAPQALADAAAVVAGLAAIHDAGIVHRDIKPENVLRMPDGRLVLTDFGLAAIPTQQISLTRFVGTPSYMAPELGQGAPASVASDLWSLGVVLYELLLGGRPRWRAGGRRRGSARSSTLDAGEAGGPLSGDAAVEKLCADCLSLAPENRPPSARAVAERLQALSADPAARSRGATRWPRSARRLALVAMAAALAAGIGLSARLLRLRQPEASAPAPPPPAVPRPIRPVVLVRNAFTMQTPGWAASIANKQVRDMLAQIGGIEVGGWRDGHQPPPGEPYPFVVEVASGKEDEVPEPAGRKRRSGAPAAIPVDVRVFGPEGGEDALSSQSCPGDGFAACLPRSTLPFIKGSLQASLREHIIRERVRREATDPRASAALQMYFSLPRLERTSGVSTEAGRALDLALQAQPDLFPARLEKIGQAIGSPRRRADLGELRSELERLREARPGEPGLATLGCRLATLALTRGTPTDAALEAAMSTCREAMRTEVDDDPALLALAQLEAQRCDSKVTFSLLERLFAEQALYAGESHHVWSDLRTPASRGGPVTVLLLADALAPFENRSHWSLTVALVSGAADLRDGHLDSAEARFRLALGESRAQGLWESGTFGPYDAHRAASLLGLIAVRHRRKLAPSADLSGELERAELGRGWGSRDDAFSLVPYLWVDPHRVRRFLGQLPATTECGPTVRRAILWQALGDRAARDAALAACPAGDGGQAWLRSCRKLLSGPLPPGPGQSVLLRHPN